MNFDIRVLTVATVIQLFIKHFKKIFNSKLFYFILLNYFVSLFLLFYRFYALKIILFNIDSFFCDFNLLYNSWIFTDFMIFIKSHLLPKNPENEKKLWRHFDQTQGPNYMN